MKVSTVVSISLLVDGMVGVPGLGEHMEISWDTTEMQYHVMSLKKNTIYITVVMMKVNIVSVMVMVGITLENMEVVTTETVIVMVMVVTVVMEEGMVEVTEDMVAMVVMDMVVEEEVIEMRL